MSLVAAIAMAASTVTLPNCSWDKPGVNPFMGDLVAAVDRYKDIPAATRAKLKARMQARQYDEIVDIHRDSIVGRYEYGSDIRDMHFGAGSVCKTVTRAKWTDQSLERGLVYCEDGQCILVPTVCRNVSRINRGNLKPAAGGPTAKNEEEPLMFDPPAAGGAEGGGGDPGSFSRTAGLPPTATSDTSLVVPPGGSAGGGGGSIPSVGGPGVITLPQLPQGGGNNGGNPPIPGVPEPQTWLLFALGLGALAFTAKRRSVR
ncbi:MHFG family PEP-CTERM protein [Mitsuaria sp. GD03876]|uniref:MHFG family PEP-CTERM protein n=1 Tax=Mitsuaria sp. GD03876 TaxID=2975399 RepID=UPI00244D5215|nr:MHFG family PEP-CTERM protein [Mitsuaria sp. GD03876]MDH0865496.1 MHFG family PEP-CTERM protein [Mitsuaria sp. GD03876]